MTQKSDRPVFFKMYCNNPKIIRIKAIDLFVIIVAMLSSMNSLVRCAYPQKLRLGLLPKTTMRLTGGSDEAETTRLSEQELRAAERRIIIEKLIAEADSTERGQYLGGDDQRVLQFDQDNLTSKDFFAENDVFDPDPPPLDDPLRGWDPSVLELEERGSSLEEEHNLFVQTTQEISPLYDEEYEQMQREALEHGQDPLPDRRSIP